MSGSIIRAANRPELAFASQTAERQVWLAVKRVPRAHIGDQVAIVLYFHWQALEFRRGRWPDLAAGRFPN